MNSKALYMQTNDRINKMKSLIAEGKTENAIKVLNECIQQHSEYSEFENEFLSISNRYERYKQRELLNLSVEKTEINDIIHGLLVLSSKMNQLEGDNGILEDFNSILSQQESIKRKNNILKISIVIASCSIVMVFGFSSSTMIIILAVIIGYAVASKLDIF